MRMIYFQKKKEKYQNCYNEILKRSKNMHIYMQNGLSIIQTFNYINAPFGSDRNTAWTFCPFVILVAHKRLPPEPVPLKCQFRNDPAGDFTRCTFPSTATPDDIC